MTALQGGFRRTPTDFDDFVDLLVKTITPEEWRILAQLPPLKHVTKLISAVVAIREVPRYPLPASHPLNPASRFAEDGAA